MSTETPSTTPTPQAERTLEVEPTALLLDEAKALLAQLRTANEEAPRLAKELREASANADASALTLKRAAKEAQESQPSALGTMGNALLWSGTVFVTGLCLAWLAEKVAEGRASTPTLRAVESPPTLRAVESPPVQDQGSP